MKLFQTKRSSRPAKQSRRSSIRLKLMLSFGSIAALLLVVGALAFVQIVNLTNEYQVALDKRTELIRISGQISTGVYKRMTGMRGYVVSGMQLHLGLYEEGKRDLTNALSEADALVSSEQGKSLLEYMRTLLKDLDATHDEAAAAVKANNKDQATQQLFFETQISTDLSKAVTDFTKLQLELAAADQTRLEELAKLTEWALAAICGIAIVLAFILALLLSKRMSVSIGQMAQSARRISQGDLTVEPLAVRSNDELGDLAGALNGMTDNLRQLVREVSASSQSVTQSANELAGASDQAAQIAQSAAAAVGTVTEGANQQTAAADEVRMNIAQLQQAIQQIALGAAESTTGVQQASRMMSDMVNALEQVSGDATSVADSTQRAAENAQTGAGAIARTVESMERINQVVGDSAERIQKLERLSGDIGKVTEMITAIAEQTNLLALNAAIEAARAGEHGRGFAVVAEEVRKLAERASASTRTIGEIIGQIQSETAEAVSAMTTGTREVAAGSQLAADAGTVLQEILSAMETAAADISRIARTAAQARHDVVNVAQAFDAVATVTEENSASTEEMSAGTEHVVTSISSIAATSKENAIAAQEVSAAVEELTASSEEVAAAATSLQTVAAELQRQVDQFRLR